MTKKSMNDKTLANQNNLRKTREEKRLSQRILAMACAQDISQIRKYEKGQHMPSYSVLRSLSRFLEVPIEELYPAVADIDKRLDRVKELILHMADKTSRNS